MSALLLLIGGPILCAAIWRGPIFPPQNPNLVPLFVIAALLLYGIYQTANAFISTVTLHQDSVELRTAFSRQSLLFSEIRGRRQYISYAFRSRTPYFKLVPKDDRHDSLSFEQAYKFDQAFFHWFNQLPDLDAADEKSWNDSKSGLA